MRQHSAKNKPSAVLQIALSIALPSTSNLTQTEREADAKNANKLWRVLWERSGQEKALSHVFFPLRGAAFCRK
jgi:hypothetical protein